MTVHIRLPGGYEDAYPATKGEGHTDNGYYSYGSYYNPGVYIEHGALVVQSPGYRRRLGYYPPGAWLSWRTD